MTDTPNPCGCRAIQRRWAGSDSIIYCPFHAAAPDLLEVAVKYHEWLERHDELTRPERPGAPRRGYIGLDHHIGENVEGCSGCAAIASAKGDV